MHECNLLVEKISGIVLVSVESCLLCLCAFGSSWLCIMMMKQGWWSNWVGFFCNNDPCETYKSLFAQHSGFMLVYMCILSVVTGHRCHCHCSFGFLLISQWRFLGCYCLYLDMHVCRSLFMREICDRCICFCIMKCIWGSKVLLWLLYQWCMNVIWNYFSWISWGVLEGPF